MELKTTVVDATPDAIIRTYPYMGILDTGASRTIVLFTSMNAGVYLSNDARPDLVGFYESDHQENKYSLYHGSVTLSM